MFSENENLCAAWREHALKKDGLKVRVGRWNIPGEPIIILVDFYPFFSKRNEIYGRMWENFKSIHFMLMEITTKRLCFLMSSRKCGLKLYRFNLTENDRVIYQAHEWMTGMGAFICRKRYPK